MIRHFFPQIDTSILDEEEMARLSAEVIWLEKREISRMASAISQALSAD